MHNSVYLSHSAVSSNSHAVLSLSGVDSAFVKSNMLVNDAHGLIYKFSNNDYFEGDFNNYWTDDIFADEWYGGLGYTSTTLTDFSLHYSSDINSTIIQPFFIAPNHLIPLNANQLDNLGTPIGYVTSDIL